MPPSGCTGSGRTAPILRANRAELDMLGYGREEYVGRPIADFHADEDVICDILRRLQAGEKLDEYPARLRCKDGSIKDVLIDSSVLWRDGRVRPHPLLHQGRDRAEAGRGRGAGAASSGPARSWRASPTPSSPWAGTGGSPTSTGRPRRCWAGAGTTCSARCLVGASCAATVRHASSSTGYRRAMGDGVTVTFEEFYAPARPLVRGPRLPVPGRTLGLLPGRHRAAAARGGEGRLLAEAEEANRAKTQFLAVLCTSCGRR